MQGIKADAHIDRLSTKDILDKLLPLLRDMTGGRQVVGAIDDFVLPVREGSSLALLLSELVSNAVKHGRGVITISLRADRTTAHLAVTDQGRGFAADFDLMLAANTGLTLIDIIGRHDLRGELSFDTLLEGGAGVHVVFPIPSLD